MAPTAGPITAGIAKGPRGSDDWQAGGKQTSLGEAEGSETTGTLSVGQLPAVAFQERGREGGRNLEYQEEVAYSLNAPHGGGRRHEMNVVVPYNIVGSGQEGRNHAYEAVVSGCLQHKGLAASGNEAGTLVKSGMAVRRLTPRECERLQGFPDDYTLIPWRGRPRELCPDGPRYRAIGNSIAIPDLRWIGGRIMLVDRLASAST